MNRPWLLRALPDRLRTSVWARLYRGRHASWEPLYAAASLRFAPRIHMELVPGDFISDCIAFTGLYELALTRRMGELAPRGGTLIDVGANLGYFALLWAAASPSNKCIAFEPSPRILEILRRNVSRNGLEAQIDVIPMAAGSVSGRARFDVGPADQTGWGGLAAPGCRGAIEVGVVRIDEVVRSDKQIALLKVDTEGAEAWTLMGCDRLLKDRAVQEIWYEQNKPRMTALGIPLAAAQDYLRAVGYTSSPLGNPAAELVEWSAVPGLQRPR